MFEQTFKNIKDILLKEAGCASELDYTEQPSWLLFLKYLDALETERAMEAELVGESYTDRRRYQCAAALLAARRFQTSGQSRHHRSRTGF